MNREKWKHLTSYEDQSRVRDHSVRSQSTWGGESQPPGTGGFRFLTSTSHCSNGRLAPSLKHKELPLLTDLCM